MSEVSDHMHREWTVTVAIDEHGGRTRAEARLQWRDREALGVGVARLAPTDRYVAQIGDELAAARALADLARRMMAGTVHQIETIVENPSGGAVLPTP